MRHLFALFLSLTLSCCEKPSTPNRNGKAQNLNLDVRDMGGGEDTGVEDMDLDIKMNLKNKNLIDQIPIEKDYAFALFKPLLSNALVATRTTLAFFGLPKSSTTIRLSIRATSPSVEASYKA